VGGGVAPYIGAAAAVPTAGAALTVVAHDGRLQRAPLPATDHWRSPWPNLLKFQTVV
jgi:hypothetical protein